MGIKLERTMESLDSKLNRLKLIGIELKRIEIKLLPKLLPTDMLKLGIENPINIVRIDKRVKKLIIPDGVDYIGMSDELEDLVKNMGSNVEELELPESLIAIGSHTFSKFGIKKLVIPKSVRMIGEAAFIFCKKLKDVNFSMCEQLESIGEGTFCNTALIEVKLPTSLKSIGKHAFLDCSLLRRIDFNNAELTVIDTGTFRDCRNLESVTNLCNSIKRIEDDCFYFCYSLNDIKMPKKIKYLGNRAFFNTSMSEINLQDTELEEIWSKCFCTCKNTKEIKFPNSLHYYSFGAIYGCEVECIDLSNTCIEVLNLNFFDIECPKLKKVILPKRLRDSEGLSKLKKSGYNIELFEWV